jgi:hypothetical protein
VVARSGNPSNKTFSQDVEQLENDPNDLSHEFVSIDSFHDLSRDSFVSGHGFHSLTEKPISTCFEGAQL